MEDKFGYTQLKLNLTLIATQLEKENKPVSSKKIKGAIKFYGGIPSEFLGESLLALQDILKNEANINSKTKNLIENLSYKIKNAFKKANL